MTLFRSRYSKRRGQIRKEASKRIGKQIFRGKEASPMNDSQSQPFAIGQGTEAPAFRKSVRN